MFSVTNAIFPSASAIIKFSRKEKKRLAENPRVNENVQIKNLPTYTVSSGNNVIVVNETGTTVEATLVHESGHPRIFVRGCWSSTDDSVLLIRYTAFWKPIHRSLLLVTCTEAGNSGGTLSTVQTVTSVSLARNHTYWLTLLHWTWSSVNSVTWCNKFAKWHGGKWFFFSIALSFHAEEKQTWNTRGN